MNIGFDIDGVLTKIDEYQLKIGREFFKKKYDRDIINPNGFSIREIFDATDEEFMDFWSSHLLSYSINELSRTGASEYIKKLVEEGNNIFIITSREFTTKNNALGLIMRHLVKAWLKKEGIPYDGITFCDEDKIEEIKKNQIQIMVEDNPINIKKMSNYIDVICMDAPYNRDLKLPRVTHVTDFKGVYDSVNDIRKRVKQSLTDPVGVKTNLMSLDRVFQKFYNEKQANLFLTDESMYEYIYRNNKDNLDAFAHCSILLKNCLKVNFLS